MERTALDQAIELLGKEQEVLIVAPEKNTADAFCAMVGLAMALEKLGKKVKMVCASHVPQSLQFLPGTSQVQDYLERTNDLLVDIPLNNTKTANISWEQHGDVLRFIITPKRGGVFQETSAYIQNGLYPWKLIITVGAADLNSLGAPFTEHAPFFYDTPILNIDRGTANEFFGTVNMVTATAGTVTEVVYELLDALGGVNIVTPEVATILFAGLLMGTRSFQSVNTTPRTFTIASELLDQEADRQTVTRNLFKTHKLPELRLLGRSMARLRELTEGVLWSAVLQKDFEESGAKHDDLAAVLQEMSERAGEQTPVILVFERVKGNIEALIAAGKISQEDREKIRAKLNGVLAGHFVLVSLGDIAIVDLEKTVGEVIVPQLPRTV